MRQYNILNKLSKAKEIIQHRNYESNFEHSSSGFSFKIVLFVASMAELN